MLLLPVLLNMGGCAANDHQTNLRPHGRRVVCVVPGAGGADYSGLRRALREADGAADVLVVQWGAPGPLFVLNLQSTSIHEGAERKLAERITVLLHEDPTRRIDLVGHSAGCGVILGALRRLGDGARVERVVLLSPSVSPGYPLAAPLTHMNGRVDVFYSDRDTVFLKWRTGTFGTYDNVRTPAAGNLGFQPSIPLPAELAGKLVQHAYDPKWASLGNDGGHTGSTAYPFVRSVVMPLLNESGQR